ncbi:unnamed protein product [Bursaphelenchus okinawaensis]|uniref:EF-hand domain-containing protein n=1 Tax=Bursaphelenchus okinawaensis TaxID=465554 RepID=A0A811KP50_9BILA|nr:unnamed protein product [Bursaphelenchus okinawaensis]CAG9107101.1 unnamed protein product [Bursaphelenchus okinawaensis]
MYDVLESCFPRLYGLRPNKPANLDKLLNQTHFDKHELRLLYRYFKNFCPNGVLNFDQLKEFYAQIFPRGQSEQYAWFVHRAFDLNFDGDVDFEDLAMTYSILTRGTAEERADWIFNFYDSQKEDKLGRIQLLSVMKSIYGLLGDKVRPIVHAPAIFSHMCDIFEKITHNETQYISRQQFLDYFLNSPSEQEQPTSTNSTKPSDHSSTPSIYTSDSNLSRITTDDFVTPYSSQCHINENGSLIDKEVESLAKTRDEDGVTVISVNNLECNYLHY